jgi:circadian clock protein KaiB
MSKGTHFKFRLYIAGDAPNSTQAVANLKAFGEEHLQGRYEIEFIDVMREQARALADAVLLTPMVVRVAPAPVRKIIGNLSDRKPLLQLLE